MAKIDDQWQVLAESGSTIVAEGRDVQFEKLPPGRDLANRRLSSAVSGYNSVSALTTSAGVPGTGSCCDRARDLEPVRGWIFPDLLELDCKFKQVFLYGEYGKTERGRTQLWTVPSSATREVPNFFLIEDSGEEPELSGPTGQLQHWDVIFELVRLTSSNVPIVTTQKGSSVKKLLL